MDRLTSKMKEIICLITISELELRIKMEELIRYFENLKYLREEIG